MANMFNEDGTYNKTEWKAGDKITAVKLNKIESSLEAINNNDIDRHVKADSRLDILEERMANTPDNEQMDALADMVKDNKDAADLAVYKINRKIESLESNTDSRLDTLESNTDSRLDALEGVNAGSRLDALEGVNADSRLGALEGVNAGDRLGALESEMHDVWGNLYCITPEERLDTESDDTGALQRAVNSGGVVYINRNLIISDTIKLRQNTIICGNGKSDTSNTITMTNDEKFLFEYTTKESESAYDLTVGIRFNDLRIIAKNVVRLNDRNLDFTKVGHIKGFKIDCCKMTGKTTSNGKSYTNEIPEYDELAHEGIAIQLTKVFDFAIRDSEIERYGIAVDLLGSDIGLMDNCRVAYNDRHYHAVRTTGTYGSQCKIKNCDVMWNQRYGAIYLDRTAYDTLEDNYFECYYKSATYIVARSTFGTSIINNRFDDSGQTDIPMCVLEPWHGLLVAFNRFNRGATPSYMEILPTYYEYIFRNNFAKVVGNIDLPLRICPYVRGESLDTSVFNPQNIPYMDGVMVSSGYPFEQVDGVWKIKQTSNGSCILRVKPPVRTDTLKLYVETYDTDNGTFHANIMANDVGGGFLLQRQISKKSHWITLENVGNVDYILFEYVTSTVNLKSLKVFNYIPQ